MGSTEEDRPRPTRGQLRLELGELESASVRAERAAEKRRRQDSIARELLEADIDITEVDRVRRPTDH